MIESKVALALPQKQRQSRVSSRSQFITQHSSQIPNEREGRLMEWIHLELRRSVLDMAIFRRCYSNKEAVEEIPFRMIILIQQPTDNRGHIHCHRIRLGVNARSMLNGKYIDSLWEDREDEPRTFTEWNLFTKFIEYLCFACVNFFLLRLVQILIYGQKKIIVYDLLWFLLLCTSHHKKENRKLNEIFFYSQFPSCFAFLSLLMAPHATPVAHPQ